MISNKRTADLLPVGSIITLKGDKKEYMINGYGGFYKTKENNQIEADYFLVEYPLGFIDIETTEIKYIMSNEIEQIIFNGYDDLGRRQFLDEIDKLRGEINEENK